MMKRIFLFLAAVASILTSSAQIVLDNFSVGPYIVDYLGEGDIRFRLDDNIDLYEFFELKKDTTIVAPSAVSLSEPIAHAIEISGKVGANRFASRELAIEGLWKQRINPKLFFNGGISLAFGHARYQDSQNVRNMFEVGIPLQIELGKLDRRSAGFYGLFGIVPTVYTTMSVKGKYYYNDVLLEDKDLKKSGFLIAPTLELGGNIPVGNVNLRLGVYGTYKINCTVGNYDVYKNSAGRMFFGARLAVII